MEITTKKYKVKENKEREFLLKEPAGKDVYVNRIEADYTEINEALTYNNDEPTEEDICVNVVRFIKNEEEEKEEEERMKALKEEVHNIAFSKELTFPDNDYDPDDERQVNLHIMERLNEDFGELFQNISRRLRTNSKQLKSLPGYVTFKDKIKGLGFGWWEKENGSLGQLENAFYSSIVKERLNIMFDNMI